MERPPGRDRHDLADSRPGARRDHTGQQQARNRAEQPGPPCSLKATSTTRATPTTGRPAAIRTGGSRQKHAADGRQQGQGPRSQPGQGTRPRAKKRTTKTSTATTTTRATSSQAAGSRPRSCRRITRPAAGEYRQRLRRSGTRWTTLGRDRHDLAASRPGARWNHPGRGSPGRLALCRWTTTAPAAIRTDGDRQQDHADADRQQGQEQRSEQGQGNSATGKEENDQEGHSAEASRQTA